MKEKIIIVGAGPVGLTLALTLSKHNKEIIIIDKNDSIGGCHRVMRKNELFSEHGPRIYSSCYLTFRMLLNDMKLKFYDLFVPYKFNISNIGGNIFDHLSCYELFTLFVSFLNINKMQMRITMEQYMKDNKFSDNAKDYIDRLCRMTDGAGSDRYTLYGFLQLANQNLLYTIYQPKEPNDIGLFKYWKEELEKNDVKIILETDIVNMNINNNNIKSIIVKNNNNNDIYEIDGDKFIFAIPPHNMSKILINNNLLINSFGDNFIKWSEKTNYLEYVSITYHFDEDIELNKIWGFPSTDWGVGYIVMSDYMEFDNKLSKIVISALITKNDKSKYTNKTPNETSDRKELEEEVFRQLKISFPNLPKPVYVISSQNYYDNNKWIPKDTSFIKTKDGYIKSKSEKYNNLYLCGICNGNSNYSFTSMESAIQNALTLAYELEPEIENKYKIYKCITITDIIICIIIMILVIIFVVIYIK